MKWLLNSFLLFCLVARSQEKLCKNFTDIPAMEQRVFEARANNALRSFASSNFNVNFYRCTWKVDPAVRYIDGKVAAYFTVTSATNNIVFDLTTVLTVDSVLFRNQKIVFTQNTNATLSLQFPVTLAAEQKDSVITYYHGVPDNTGFGSFIQSTHAGVPVIWTLSEPYGARDWWPCKNLNDEKVDSIDVIIIHPSQYKATSNGLLQSETTVGSSTTTFFKHRYPIASYLVAFSVTNFAVFNNSVQLGSTNLPMVTYVYPENQSDFQAGTQKVLNALQLFHNTFGPYPFIKEKYGHTQFGWGGGMEHQTNSFITSIDEALIAHELAHQWFGDKITCGSWQDIWLNEGFATFCTNYYFEKTDPPFTSVIMGAHLASIVSQPAGSVFVTDTSNVGNIFNGRLVYYKGAFVLRMLRFTLGDSLFFKGVRQYQNDPALQYRFAKTVDFKRHMEQASNQNLDYFFDQWIYGQGHPSFTVQWSQNKNNWAKVKVSETTSHSSVPFYRTPLPLTFKNATQQKTVIVQCNANNDETWVDIDFAADTVWVDKDLQLISKDNQTKKLQPASLLQNEIKIYPNPVTSQLYVSLKNPSEKQTTIQLFNDLGQLLWAKIFDTPGQDELLNIPFAQYQRGIYVLKVNAGNSIKITKKILK